MAWSLLHCPGVLWAHENKVPKAPEQKRFGQVAEFKGTTIHAPHGYSLDMRMFITCMRIVLPGVQPVFFLCMGVVPRRA